MPSPSRASLPTAEPLDGIYYVADNEQDAQALCEQIDVPVKLRRVVREEVLYVPFGGASTSSQTSKSTKRLNAQNVQTSAV